MYQQRIEYRGRQVSYRKTGSGPAVVLLHGFGEDSTIWQNQYNIFPDHLLIIPDLPGSGASEMTEDMSMEGLADAVLSVLDAEEVSKCILIGHSMGGYIGLAFAERYLDRLNGFGLFHSTAFADTEEKKEARRKGIAFIEKNGAAAFLKSSVPNLYWTSPQPLPKCRDKFSTGGEGLVTSSRTLPTGREGLMDYSTKRLVEQHLASVSCIKDETLISYYQSMIARPERVNILEKSTVPVLFVLGQYDNAVPLSDGLRQCHLPQLSQVELLKEAGHMGMVEMVEAANECLKMFVSITRESN